MTHASGIDWVTGTSFTLSSEITTSILKSLENTDPWETENKWNEPLYCPGLLPPESVQSAEQGVNAGRAQQTPWFEKTEPIGLQGEQWG